MGVKLVTLDLISKFVLFSILMTFSRFTLKFEIVEVKFDLLYVLKTYIKIVIVVFVSAFLTYLLLNTQTDTMIILSGIVSTTAGICVAGTPLHAGVIDCERTLLTF